MPISIASSCDVCRKAFDDFITYVQDPELEKPEGLHVQAWQDELGRLRIWAANIGAHQTGQSSLDFRLRDSSHISQQIVKLLSDLRHRLKDVTYVVKEGQDDDVESLQGSSSENDFLPTEIEQLRDSVASIINCLFDMSMLVRKPAQHDHRIGSNRVDVSHFVPHDYGHVRDKFPNANEKLVSRLSDALTRRRKYLKYRERHAMKLKQGIDSDIGHPETLSETVATDYSNWNITSEDNASDSGFSQTSYAPTLISGGGITIPGPPKASQGGAPFECPYCYFIIAVKGSQSWNRHVFNDLQPYVCTELNCTTPDKLYSTRHEWLHHLQTAHANRRLDQSRGEGQGTLDCVLCGDPLKSKRRRDRHLARHLQELALFVLPRNEDESEEENHSNDQASSSKFSSVYESPYAKVTGHINLAKDPSRQPFTVSTDPLDSFNSTSRVLKRGESPRRFRRIFARSSDRNLRNNSPTLSDVDPDLERERKLRRLEEIERWEMEESARQKFEEERIVEEARRARELKELEKLKLSGRDLHTAAPIGGLGEKKIRLLDELEILEMKNKESARQGFEEQKFFN